jgi:membrane-bound serine protease (ClpP class)
MYINPWLFTLIVIVIVVFLVFVVIWVVHAHQRKIAAGKEELIGRTAIVKVALNPKGVVLVEGEHWTAVSDSGRIEADEEVVITGVDSLQLTVTRKK